MTCYTSNHDVDNIATSSASVQWIQVITKQKQKFFVKELRNYGLILTRFKRLFSTPKWWDKLKDSTRLLFSRYGSLFPKGQNRQSMKLTTHLHTVQIMWWTKKGNIVQEKNKFSNNMCTLILLPCNGICSHKNLGYYHLSLSVGCHTI